jgi:hypothetical protein
MRNPSPHFAASCGETGKTGKPKALVKLSYISKRKSNMIKWLDRINILCFSLKQSFLEKYLSGYLYSLHSFMPPGDMLYPTSCIFEAVHTMPQHVFSMFSHSSSAQKCL